MSTPLDRSAIFRLVDAERVRQEAKWGGEHAHGWGSCADNGVAPFVKAAVLGEECGEVQRALLDGDRAGLAKELVQVAAVAVAWLESL